MRIFVSIALIVSGVCAILADWQRWWPACAGRHRFDSHECLLLQDHLYDFAFPSSPWVPIGQSALFMGLSYALLGLAALFVFRVALASVWMLVPGAAAAASFGVVAANSFASGAAGRPVEVSGSGLAHLFVIALWPLMLMILALGAFALAAHPDHRRWWTVATATALLAISSPVALYFTSSFLTFYASHDTSPWYEAVGGLLTLLAGVAIFRAPPTITPRTMLAGIEQKVEP